MKLGGNLLLGHKSIIECKKKKKKKKKEEEEEEEKKKYNAHYDKTQMQRKTWERWTQGRPWLVIDNLALCALSMKSRPGMS